MKRKKWLKLERLSLYRSHYCHRNAQITTWFSGHFCFHFFWTASSQLPPPSKPLCRSLTSYLQPSAPRPLLRALRHGQEESRTGAALIRWQPAGVRATAVSGPTLPGCSAAGCLRLSSLFTPSGWLQPLSFYPPPVVSPLSFTNTVCCIVSSLC